MGVTASPLLFLQKLQLVQSFCFGHCFSFYHAAFATTAVSDSSWAALMVTIPSLGINVQVPEFGSGVFGEFTGGFYNEPVTGTNGPITVAAGQTIVACMNINNVQDPQIGPVFPPTDVTDSFGNYWYVISVWNSQNSPVYPWQMAGAVFMITFNSPAGDDYVTSSFPSNIGQNGEFLSFGNLVAPPAGVCFGSLLGFGV
jgi:hypothetical protein